ncbi:MAG: 3-deoxy-D-manno-octulosonic acid transferase, partial [Tolumonas sp.]
ITRQLTDNHACLIIQNAQELAHEISRLLQDEVTRQQMGMAAFDVVAANQGALDKSLQAIARVLDQR